MSALLLFGKEEIIQSAIPHYKIDALVKKENIDRYDDRDNIRCNLIEAYDRLMAFVSKHLPDKFYLQGDQRISLRDKIFREIIANILIHREYTNAFPTSFIIYKNMVEAKNANKPHIHRLLKPGNFEPHPKNPHIAQIFTQMGRSEELGTGVNNVFKYSKAYSGNDSIIFKEEDIFITTVPLFSESNKSITVNEPANDPLNDPVNDPINDPINERQNKILLLIKEKPDLKRQELARNLNVSLETIKRDLSKLKIKSLLNEWAQIKSVNGK